MSEKIIETTNQEQTKINDEIEIFTNRAIQKINFSLEKLSLS